MKKKFEYTSLSFSYPYDLTQVVSRLNYFGKDGWEVCSSHVVDDCGICFYLKREII